MTPLQTAQAITLAAAGTSVRAIARELGLSRSAIATALRHAAGTAPAVLEPPVELPEVPPLEVPPVRARTPQVAEATPPLVAPLDAEAALEAEAVRGYARSYAEVRRFGVRFKSSVAPVDHRHPRERELAAEYYARAGGRAGVELREFVLATGRGRVV